jgi:hypothetical protein
MPRRARTELEKATSEMSERFMSHPELMGALHTMAARYEALHPEDAKYGLHAIRDTIGVLVVMRMEATATEIEELKNKLLAELEEATKEKDKLKAEINAARKEDQN